MAKCSLPYVVLATTCGGTDSYVIFIVSDLSEVHVSAEKHIHTCMYGLCTCFPESVYVKYLGP